MASTRHAARHEADWVHRLGLVALTLVTVATFVWLVVSLASAAFGV